MTQDQAHDEINTPDPGPRWRSKWFDWPHIVIVVLVLAAGVYATNQRNPWGGGFSRDGSMRARLQMSELAKAIEMYKLANRGRVPESLSVLTRPDAKFGEPYLNNIALDPWNNRFRYASTGPRTFVIFSNGPDGQPDTEDDIRYPELD